VPDRRAACDRTVSGSSQAYPQGCIRTTRRPPRSIPTQFTEKTTLIRTAALVGVAAIGGTAVAATGIVSGSDDGRHAEFERELAEKLGVPQADVERALGEMHAERTTERPGELVAAGRLSQAQADAFQQQVGAGQGEAAMQSRRAALLGGALGREIDDVAWMVTGIVDLARGARPVERSEDLRLDDLVTDVVARARSRRPEAVIELDAEPAAMTGDPTRLERAIADLVENALLHSAAPVHVQVRPGEVVVDDAGPGIPPDRREAMVERFRRGVGVQDRPGSGLGLAIVRPDVAAHGGTVVIGDAPGGGCRNTVRLPARPAANRRS